MIDTGTSAMDAAMIYQETAEAQCSMAGLKFALIGMLKACVDQGPI